MNIIETNFNYKSNHTTRSLNAIDRIILHHSASNVASAEQIHQWHLSRGYAGAGYHFLVRKDGSVYSLRPLNWVGAHCQGYNTCSIGICAEGNFEEETMNEVQKNAIIELINYLKAIYRINKVTKHNDYGSTACPGRNYPFNEIINAQTINEPTPEPLTRPRDGQIVDIQNWCNSYNCNNIAVDGEFGPKTKKAITKVYQTELNIQCDVNIAVDGKYGPETKKATPNVYPGAKGNITKSIQAMLYCKHYDTDGVDGIYGPTTKKAIEKVQTESNITPIDGVYGPRAGNVIFN